MKKLTLIFMVVLAEAMVMLHFRLSVSLVRISAIVDA